MPDILSAPVANQVAETDAPLTSAVAPELVLCRYCDLLQHLPALQDGEEADCSRCGHELDARQRESALRPILYAMSALFMLVLTNLFPFVGMDAAGSHRDMTFLDTSAVLLDEDYPWLAVLVWLFIQAIPAICMVAIIYLKLGMFYRLPALVQVARLLYALKPWSMVDIFLMGLLVSFVKLLTHFELSLGMSFWAFCGNSVKYERPSIKSFTIKTGGNGDQSSVNETNNLLMKRFKRFLRNTCPFIDTDIIPASNDPSSQVFPQRPLHKALVLEKASSDSSTLNCHTNPCRFTVNDGLDVLITGGQNVDDACRYGRAVDPLDAAEYLLKSSHIAPSAPDTLCIIFLFHFSLSC